MKKIIILLTILITGVAGYSYTYAASPTEKETDLQVAVISNLQGENGRQAAVLHFTVKLNQDQILAKDHGFVIEGIEGWKPDGHSLKQDGIYQEIDYTGNVKEGLTIAVNPSLHTSDDGYIEGKIDLIQTEGQSSEGALRAAASVSFHYRSYVNDFTITDSVSWENKSAEES
ncbi:hypothetical protein [Jeotgalibacillus terrae]|uniref:Uncharacterized protein n=1 Tax=Jeotgalibacillus terrae TaxID=587735 RepID=A0ABW5ZIW9_9BACL|nr:hypothetical protein [Jeotgalibacillus terrae]MBM7578675.1 hypothetical protein [Jeotgalibacillus terrae]